MLVNKTKDFKVRVRDENTDAKINKIPTKRIKLPTSTATNAAIKKRTALSDISNSGSGLANVLIQKKSALAVKKPAVGDKENEKICINIKEDKEVAGGVQEAALKRALGGAKRTVLAETKKPKTVLTTSQQSSLASAASEAARIILKAKRKVETKAIQVPTEKKHGEEMELVHDDDEDGEFLLLEVPFYTSD